MSTRDFEWQELPRKAVRAVVERMRDEGSVGIIADALGCSLVEAEGLGTGLVDWRGEE